MLEYDKKEVSGSMLNKAEMKILYDALYISLNYKEFKKFTQKKRPALYKKIYESYGEQLLTREQIKEIINNNGFKIIEEIKNAEEELNKGTLEDHIRWMIIHYNAIHTQEPDVQEVELWRPKK
jgi:hypothetical protein